MDATNHRINPDHLRYDRSRYAPESEGKPSGRAPVMADLSVLALRRDGLRSSARGAHAATTKARLSVSAPRCCLAEGRPAFQRRGKGDTGARAKRSTDKHWRLNVMTRSKLRILVFIGLSVVVLAAYAGAQPGLDVTGTWTGSTSSGANPITLVLQQADNKLTGTLSGAGDNDGNVTGTVQENTVRLRNAKGNIPVLTVRGEQMTGTLSGGTAVTLSRTAK